MKIAFFEIESWEEDLLKKNLTEDEIFFLNEKIDDYKGEQKDFDIISVFTFSPVNGSVYVTS